MKLILDIQDNKAAEFIAMIKEFSFVKTKQLSSADDELLTEIEEIKIALNHAEALKKGSLKSRPLEDLLNEL